MSKSCFPISALTLPGSFSFNVTLRGHSSPNIELCGHIHEDELTSRFVDRSDIAISGISDAFTLREPTLTLYDRLSIDAVMRLRTNINAAISRYRMVGDLTGFAVADVNDWTTGKFYFIKAEEV